MRKAKKVIEPELAAAAAGGQPAGGGSAGPTEGRAGRQASPREQAEQQLSARESAWRNDGYEKLEAAALDVPARLACLALLQAMPGLDPYGDEADLLKEFAGPIALAGAADVGGLAAAVAAALKRVKERWGRQVPILEDGPPAGLVALLAAGWGVDLPPRPKLEDFLPGKEPVAAPAAEPSSEGAGATSDLRRCRVCGCTSGDCGNCVEKTGDPCDWVEWDLCSACTDEARKSRYANPPGGSATSARPPSPTASTTCWKRAPDGGDGGARRHRLRNRGGRGGRGRPAVPRAGRVGRDQRHGRADDHAQGALLGRLPGEIPERWRRRTSPRPASPSAIASSWASEVPGRGNCGRLGTVTAVQSGNPDLAFVEWDRSGGGRNKGGGWEKVTNLKALKESPAAAGASEPAAVPEKAKFHALDEDVAGVLRSRVEYDGDKVRITGERLEGKLYQRAKKALELLGGEWKGGKVQAHVLPGEARPLVEAVLGDGKVLDRKKTFQFFETPRALAERMVELAGIGPGMSVLEPSAGLCDRGCHSRAAHPGEAILCVELDGRSHVGSCKRGTRSSPGISWSTRGGNDRSTTGSS